MRQISSALLLVGLLAACTKPLADPQGELVGQWRLVDYCKPATGGCIQTSVATADAVTIEFTSTRAFTERYARTPPAHFFMGCSSGSYQREGDQVTIALPCSSSSSGRRVAIARLNAAELVINFSSAGVSSGQYRFVRL